MIEGTKISFTYIIPAACALYSLYILTAKEILKKFANKILISGIALIVVVPFSTHFTETACQDYMEYVDKTIEEANKGAQKIYKENLPCLTV